MSTPQDNLDPFADISDLFANPGDDREANRAYARAQAQQRGLDPDFVDRLFRQESGYNRRAVSPKGAQGVGQMMPSTGRRYGLKDPFNAQENIDKSLDYISDLHKRFNGNLRLIAAGYHSGEGAAEKALRNPKGNPKTAAYVRNVAGEGSGNSADPFADISDLLETGSPAPQSPQVKPTAPDATALAGLEDLLSGAQDTPATAIQTPSPDTRDTMAPLAKAAAQPDPYELELTDVRLREPSAPISTLEEAADYAGVPREQFAAIPRLSDGHSDEWKRSQADMAKRATAAGLPQTTDSRQRLIDAINRAEQAGFKTPHFIGTPDEPSGDRAVSRDVENLVSSLKAQEAATPAGSARGAVSKERAYWEQEATEGMTAEEWQKQTGDPEPLYPGEVSSAKGPAEAVNIQAGDDSALEGDVYREWTEAMKSGDFRKASTAAQIYSERFPKGGKYARHIYDPITGVDTGPLSTRKEAREGAVAVHVGDLSEVTDEEFRHQVEQRFKQGLGFDDAQYEVFKQKYGFDPAATSGYGQGRGQIKQTPEEFEQAVKSGAGEDQTFLIRVPKQAAEKIQEFFNDKKLSDPTLAQAEAVKIRREGAAKLVGDLLGEDFLKGSQQFAAGMTQGMVGTMGSAAKGTGILLREASKAIDGDSPTPISDMLIGSGDWLNRFTQSASFEEADPDGAALSAFKLGQGLGSGATFALTGVAGKVGAGITGALSQAGSSYDETYKRLTNRGVSPQEAHQAAMNAAILNVPIGFTEMFGVGGSLERALAGGVPGAGFAKNLLGAIIKGAGEEGLSQERFQNRVGNIVARVSGDPARPLSEGEVSSVLVGILTGGLMEGAARVATGSRVAADQSAFPSNRTLNIEESRDGRESQVAHPLASPQTPAARGISEPQAAALDDLINRPAARPTEEQVALLGVQPKEAVEAVTPTPETRKEPEKQEVKGAEEIRKDEGQIPSRGTVREGGEGQGRADIQRAKEAEPTASDAQAQVAPHEFSSTQVNLPESEATRRVQRIAKAIPDRALAEDGREDEPHITVKYGLHGDDAVAVKKVLADEGPITVTLGKTSIFPAKEGADYDVVKVDVDSPDLHRLNKKIADALPNTDTFPEYKPHVTIAYVKPGEGKKYAGKSPVEGQTIKLDSIAFSDKAGNVTEIPLKGTKPTEVALTPREQVKRTVAQQKAARVETKAAEVAGAKAKSLRRQADEITKRAMALVQRIPAGQPIVSKADRNLRERSNDLMRKGADLIRQAERLEAGPQAEPAPPKPKKPAAPKPPQPAAKMSELVVKKSPGLIRDTEAARTPAKAPTIETKAAKVAEIKKAAGEKGVARTAGSVETQAAKEVSAIPRDKIVSTKETHAAERKFYFNEAGEEIASSREQPIGRYDYKPGTWRIDEHFGTRGHEIEKLVVLEPNDLHLSEDDYTVSNVQGRGYDADRYAGWMKEGKVAPPINVVQTDEGNFKVTDGHRRVAAAKKAKQKILAWVSYRMETGQQTPEGKPIYVGMTYEGAIHGPERAYSMWQDRQNKLGAEIQAQRAAAETVPTKPLAPRDAFTAALQKRAPGKLFQKKDTPLLTAIRRAGGIDPDTQEGKDIARYFSRKEGGHGLMIKGGKKVDQLVRALREEDGFPFKQEDDPTFNAVDELLSAMQADAEGKPFRSYETINVDLEDDADAFLAAEQGLDNVEDFRIINKLGTQKWFDLHARIIDENKAPTAKEVSRFRALSRAIKLSPGGIESIIRFGENGRSESATEFAFEAESDALARERAKAEKTRQEFLTDYEKIPLAADVKHPLLEIARQFFRDKRTDYDALAQQYQDTLGDDFILIADHLPTIFAHAEKIEKEVAKREAVNLTDTQEMVAIQHPAGLEGGPLTEAELGWIAARRKRDADFAESQKVARETGGGEAPGKGSGVRPLTAAGKTRRGATAVPGKEVPGSTDQTATQAVTPTDRQSFKKAMIDRWGYDEEVAHRTSEVMEAFAESYAFDVKQSDKSADSAKAKEAFYRAVQVASGPLGEGGLMQPSLDIHTSNFKRFFGEWDTSPQTASKVVDDEGKPLRVYTGHSNLEMYGERYDPKLGTAGGFYATEAPQIASNYAQGKMGAKESFESGDQYRFRLKNGKFGKKIWQMQLTPEQQDKARRFLKDEEGSGYDLEQYWKENAPYDEMNRRALARGGLRDLQSIWQFMEYMGENIAYPIDSVPGVENAPYWMRQRKSGFEGLLDHLGIEWQSREWAQPGVMAVYLNIRNPLDAEKPFPPALLAALKKASTRERRQTAEEMGYNHWTSEYPMRQWVEDIESGNEYWTTQIPKKAIPILKSFGYDGIKELGMKGAKTREERQTNWIAFDSTQIKSVFNRGTYDPNDPNFLKQSAWHGSPYHFDKFTLEHMGKGEGAQAYGWGLYFAGNREVAQYYKDKLSEAEWLYAGSPLSMRTALFKGLSLYAEQNGRNINDILDGAIKRARSDVEFNRRYSPDQAELKQYYLEALENVDRGKLQLTGTGALYKVDLKPKEDEYLLWDKPLSEQSEKVQKATKTDLAEWGPSAAATGQNLYGRLENMKGGARGASKYLNSQGIRGIKYKDQGSRGASIIPTPVMDGPNADKWEVWNGTKYEYLDSPEAALVRIQEIENDASYNYVIFDDADIAIEQVLFQEAHAATEFTNTGEAIIRAGQNPNESSGLHEMVHATLPVISRLAAQPNAPATLKTAVTAILEHSGFASVEEYVGLHEKWANNTANKAERDKYRDGSEKAARGFEGYVREGKAPTAALKAAFEWFKRVMSRIYQRVRPDMEITDSVRRAWDRLLGSEREAAASRIKEEDHWNFRRSTFASPETEARFRMLVRDAVVQGGAEHKTRVSRAEHLERVEELSPDLLPEVKRMRESQIASREIFLAAAQYSQTLVNQAMDLRTRITPSTLPDEALRLGDRIAALEHDATEIMAHTVGVRSEFGRNLALLATQKTDQLSPEKVLAFAKKLADQRGLESNSQRWRTAARKLVGLSGEIGSAQKEKKRIARERKKVEAGEGKPKKREPWRAVMLGHLKAQATEASARLQEQFGKKLYQLSNDELDRVRAKLESLKQQAAGRPIATVVSDYLQQQGLFGQELNTGQQEALREMASPTRRAALKTEQGGLFEGGIKPTLESRAEQKGETLLFGGGDEFKLFQRDRQIDTPEFKRWFGESKVVDENGEPLAVHHGTEQEFDAFRYGDVGFHFGTEAAADDRLGGAHGRTLRVYLSIKNPLRMTDVGEWSDAVTVARELKDLGILSRSQLGELAENQDRWFRGETFDFLRERLTDKGYDGIVYENTGEDWGSDSYIVFEPTQIKSAIGNRGTFDPNDKNILHQDAELPNAAHDIATILAARVAEESQTKKGLPLDRILDEMRASFPDVINQYEQQIKATADGLLKEARRQALTEASRDPEQRASARAELARDVADARRAARQAEKAAEQKQRQVDATWEADAEKASKEATAAWDKANAEWQKSQEAVAAQFSQAERDAQKVFEKQQRESVADEARRISRAAKQAEQQRLDEIADDAREQLKRTREAAAEAIKSGIAPEARARRKAEREAPQKARRWQSPIHDAAEAARSRMSTAGYQPTLQDLIAIGAEKSIDPTMTASQWHREMNQYGDLYTRNMRKVRDGAAEMRVDARKGAANRRIEERAAGRAEGLTKPTEQQQARQDYQKWAEGELARLKAEEDWQNRRIRTAKRDMAREFAALQKPAMLDTVLDALSLPMSLVSSVDLPALRQGIVPLMNHPKAWMEGLLTGASTWTEVQMEQKTDALQNHPLAELMELSGLKQSAVEQRRSPLSRLAREEQFQNRFARMFPHVRVSERQYTITMDEMRARIFTDLATPMLQDYSPALHPEHYAELARVVNIMTGIGEIGGITRYTPAINRLLFSTRLMVSRFQFLFMPVSPHFWRDMPPPVRKIAAKEWVGFWGKSAALFGTLAALGLTSLDPDDDDFVKLKIPGTNQKWELLGNFSSYLKFVAKMSRSAYRIGTGQKEFKGDRAQDTLTQFARSKLAPAPGTAVSWMTGRTFIGQPFEAKQAAIDSIFPMFARDVYEAVKLDGARGLVMAPFGILGGGVSAFRTRKMPDRTQSEAERIATGALRETMSSTPETIEEYKRRTLITELTAATKAGKPTERITRDIEKVGGPLSEKERQRVEKRVKATPLQHAYPHLRPEQQDEVLKVATEAERMSVEPHYKSIQQSTADRVKALREDPEFQKRTPSDQRQIVKDTISDARKDQRKLEGRAGGASDEETALSVAKSVAQDRLRMILESRPEFEQLDKDQKSEAMRRLGSLFRRFNVDKDVPARARGLRAERERMALERMIQSGAMERLVNRIPLGR